ncbi:unnamed protein product [Lasius platythorax]|uniref:Uncharacterized protein n=1 Tax=Lasius platythorax TaxID=488582 RepID=A0AAV2NW98_9HYME
MDGRTRLRGGAGATRSSALLPGKMPDKLRTRSGAFAPTFPWQLLPGEIAFRIRRAGTRGATKKRVTPANVPTWSYGYLTKDQK